MPLLFKLKKSFFFQFLIALLGLIIALAQFSRDLGPTFKPLEKLCGFLAEGGCEDIAGSDYAYLWGIPVTLLSASYFFLTLLFSPRRPRSLKFYFATQFFSWSITLIALTVALIYFLISVWVIDSLCSYCILQDLCIVILFLIQNQRLRERLILRPAQSLKLSFIILLQQKYLYPLLCMISLPLLMVCLTTIFYYKEVLKQNDSIKGDPLSFEIYEKMQTQVAKAIDLPPRTIEVGGIPSDAIPSENIIHIIEFIDFDCPFCLSVLKLFIQQDSTFRSHVRLSLVHFPLDPNGLPQSIQDNSANQLVILAGLLGQEKWVIEEILKMKNVRYARLKRSIQKILALKIEDQLDQYGSQISETLTRHLKTGHGIHINAVPAIFINGRKLPTLVHERTLISYIEFLIWKNKNIVTN